MNVTPMTRPVLKWFEEISKIPRKSKEEQKICQWILDWAKEKKLETQTIDTPNPGTYNIIVKVPATKGYEAAPVVVIQSHLDMVCEKTPESKHDFSKDPIQWVEDGEWLKANNTTLGADNGIGVAMALAMAEEGVEHPALELLFTVDEETGLSGANALQPGMLKGQILLNVDSEDEGRFTVGCAGGKNTHLELPLVFENAPENFVKYTLKVCGLTGGHSGVDINCQRANAISLLARVLHHLKEIPFMVSDIKGGAAHNAIPRDVFVHLFLPSADQAKAKLVVQNMLETFRAEYKKTDPNLGLSWEACQDTKDRKAVTKEYTHKLIDFLQTLPHGVNSMSVDINNLVETSNNLATVCIDKDHLKVVTSQRSSVMSRLQGLTERIESMGKALGAKVESSCGYPSWQPNMDSPILERCKKVYQKATNKSAVVEVIHAGLECAVIGSKYPKMDMISFGPTIKNPHSPDERIHVNSIGEVWHFTLELMKSFKQANL
ncbi:MAG: aminoacyl-histidine dipeptidase [Candidatus Brocadiae bacterium]|nr:aminoacyl-histidine dipeptidase [Candidatus Brocadiia bacterium]